jgi:YHS domain-containing protein
LSSANVRREGRQTAKTTAQASIPTPATSSDSPGPQFVETKTAAVEQQADKLTNDEKNTPQHPIYQKMEDPFSDDAEETDDTAAELAESSEETSVGPQVEEDLASTPSDSSSETAEEETPFTGLKLSDKQTPQHKDSAETATTEADLAEQSDVSVAQKTSEEPQIESESTPPQIIQTPPVIQPASLSPSRPDKEELKRRIAERRGTLGLRGFCPVVLREQRDLKDAKVVFVTSYKGKKYYLSSGEAKAKFDAHPERYAPVSGGTDVVLLSTTQEKFEGSLEHAVWYHGQLHLFSSDATMILFRRNPGRYVDETSELVED